MLILRVAREKIMTAFHTNIFPSLEKVLELLVAPAAK